MEMRYYVGWNLCSQDVVYTGVLEMGSLGWNFWRVGLGEGKDVFLNFKLR